MTKAHTQSKQQEKDRGGLLTAWLILMALHGIAFSFLVYYQRQQEGGTTPLWIPLSLLAVSLAKVVAAIGIWFWKKWALYLYAIAVAAAIAVGLVITASQLIVFHDIIPFVITGYLVKDKRNYFS